MKIIYLLGLPFLMLPGIIYAACSEEKSVLYSEFVAGDFDKRSSVGRDEVEPVKKKIEAYLKSVPEKEITVTDVAVTASTAKLPSYTTVNGKKVIDPKSDEKNFSLLLERSFFVEKALKEIKFPGVQFKTSAELSGPEFSPLDLNARFVTAMTPGYAGRVGTLFKDHKKEFSEKALIKSPEELLDGKKFVNLYQAKYKPFHGFRISVTGIKKCPALIPVTEEEKKPSASKQ